MLERDAELTLLSSAAQRLRAGEGGVVIVTGEAGIGKSTLVETFLDALPEGLRVLRGWCDDLVTAHPLGPIREAVRGRPGGLAIGPGLDAALAAGNVPEVLAGLSEALGHGRPAVLVVEDLHWADDATLDVLGYLARRHERMRVLLIATLRPEDSSSALRRFLGDLPTAAVRIGLEPLSRDAVAALNVTDGWSTDELLRLSGGNPFFVTEVLAGSASHGVPHTVTDAVLARLERTGAPCRRALEQLSVWSGELPHELAEAVLGDDLRGLDEAEQRGLITVGGDGVRFRHELARQVTEHSLPALRRRSIDLRLVDVLAEVPGELPRRLHHAIRCGAGPVIVEHAPQAGAYSARVGANRQAVAYFAAALEYEPLMTPRQLAEVCDSYAWVLHIAHRFDEAVTNGRRAVELWAGLGDDAAQTAALRRLARELFMAGDSEAARECAERALVLSDPDDPEVRAAALGALGSHHVLTGDPRGVELLRRARALVGSGALPGTESLCLNYLAQGEPGLEPDQRLALARSSVASALADHAFEAAARAYTNEAEALYRYGRAEALRSVLTEGLEFARGHGYWSHAYNLEVHVALEAQRRGDWADATELLGRAVTRDSEPGMLLVYSLAPYARLLARTGDPRAEEMLRRCWELAQRMRLLLGLGFAGSGLIEWAWLADRPDVAAEVMTGWQPHAARPMAEPIDAELRRYALRCGLDVPAPQPDGDPWLQLDPYERAVEAASEGDRAVQLEALRTLDLLGATATAALIRRRLTEQGVRAVPRGPSRRTRTNPVGLTDRQLDVVRLAAEGLTNAEIAERLFLSVRTVDHHVSAGLAKLGVGRRRELAAALRELGV